MPQNFHEKITPKDLVFISEANIENSWIVQFTNPCKDVQRNEDISPHPIIRTRPQNCHNAFSFPNMAGGMIGNHTLLSYDNENEEHSFVKEQNYTFYRNLHNKSETNF